MDNLAHAGVDISSSAAGPFHQLQKCEGYLSLLIARDVFEPAEKLSLAVEGLAQTLSGVREAARVTVSHLRSIHTEDHLIIMVIIINDHYI